VTQQTLFPLEPKFDEVTVYHDETKKALNKNIWGHGLLFVPDKIMKKMLSELMSIRERTKYESKLHFADISEGAFTPKYECAKSWIELGVEYLRKKYGCKLGILFFDKSSFDIRLYTGDTKKEKELKLIETILRMILKGSVHYLYDQNWRVRIKKVVTDGNPWHRKLNEVRVLGKLLQEVRDYVEISKDAEIVSISSNPNKSSDPNSAQFLQLTDLLLGSVIQCCFRNLKYGSKKEVLVRPVRELLDKRKRGRQFQKSSHYKSFTLSFVKIVKGELHFETLNTKEILINDSGQISFFDL
jgi:hypothetical protein